MTGFLKFMYGSWRVCFHKYLSHGVSQGSLSHKPPLVPQQMYSAYPSLWVWGTKIFLTKCIDGAFPKATHRKTNLFSISWSLGKDNTINHYPEILLKTFPAWQPFQFNILSLEGRVSVSYALVFSQVPLFTQNSTNLSMTTHFKHELHVAKL